MQWSPGFIRLPTFRSLVKRANGTTVRLFTKGFPADLLQPVCYIFTFSANFLQLTHTFSREMLFLAHIPDDGVLQGV